MKVAHHHVLPVMIGVGSQKRWIFFEGGESPRLPALVPRSVFVVPLTRCPDWALRVWNLNIGGGHDVASGILYNGGHIEHNNHKAAHLWTLALHWRNTGVTLALHWRYTGVTLALNWHCTDVTHVLHLRYTCVTLALHWRYNGVTMAFQLRYNGVSLALR